MLTNCVIFLILTRIDALIKFTTALLSHCSLLIKKEETLPLPEVNAFAT